MNVGAIGGYKPISYINVAQAPAKASKDQMIDDVKADEVRSGNLEGVRVLYVGMTRAIDTLICIVEESKNPMSWAKLIEEVGVDYE